MKKIIGLFILVIVLAMISGCTQPAQPATVTTPAATAVPTVPPAEATPAPTIAASPEPTILPTVVPAVLSVPKITLVPQTANTIIYMRNYAFVPTELTVLPGTGVTWVNDDSTVHAVKTIGTNAGLFSSGDIVPTASWGYTFGADEGVFEFTCTYHPTMKGTIVVKQGAEVAGAPPLQTPSS
jgi:plastocyanin